MSLTVRPTAIPEVLLVETRLFRDARGFFHETYHAEKYAGAGIERTFVQDNHSRSTKAVLRGLHYQRVHPQAKLVSALSGAIWDVAVDLRAGSPTFGQWVGEELSGENGRQLFIPEGFAHGFCVLSDEAEVAYKCSAFYAPGDDCGIRCDDPDLAISWPVAEPLLSEKDAALPRLADLPKDLLF